MVWQKILQFGKEYFHNGKMSYVSRMNSSTNQNAQGTYYITTTDIFMSSSSAIGVTDIDFWIVSTFQHTCTNCTYIRLFIIIIIFFILFILVYSIHTYIWPYWPFPYKEGPSVDPSDVSRWYIKGGDATCRLTSQGRSNPCTYQWGKLHNTNSSPCSSVNNNCCMQPRVHRMRHHCCSDWRNFWSSWSWTNQSHKGNLKLCLKQV